MLGTGYVWDTEELRPGMVSTGASYGDTTLFRNENALPLLYFADQAAADLTPGGADPFTLQNRFFSSLNGRETTYYAPARNDSLHRRRAGRQRRIRYRPGRVHSVLLYR